MNIISLYEQKNYSTILKLFSDNFSLATQLEKYYLGLVLFELGFFSEAATIILNAIKSSEIKNFSRG